MSPLLAMGTKPSFGWSVKFMRCLWLLSVLIVVVNLTATLADNIRTDRIGIDVNGTEIIEGDAKPSKPEHPIDKPSKPRQDEDPIPITDKFWQSFLSAFVMIMVSELGDKTFLIAAIMSMRHSRSLIFSASLFALALMTIVSAAFGLLLPNLISRKYTAWLAAVLFLIFGIKMTIDGSQMSSTRIREEYDEVSHEIEDSEDITRRREGTQSLRIARNLESGRSEQGCHQSLYQCLNRVMSILHVMRLERLMSPVFIQAFSLTFLAEWGDRSQIATIALAAAQNVYGVTVGSLVGHAVCTTMAVVSGRILATFLSIKAVTIIGGLLFMVFAVLAIM